MICFYISLFKYQFSLVPNSSIVFKYKATASFKLLLASSTVSPWLPISSSGQWKKTFFFFCNYICQIYSKIIIIKSISFLYKFINFEVNPLNWTPTSLNQKFLLLILYYQIQISLQRYFNRSINIFYITYFLFS